MRSSRIALPLVLGICAAIVSGCNEPQLLSRGDEVKLGRQAGDEFENQNGLDRDSADTDLVRAIGARIAPVARPPDYPYDYRALASGKVNANAFPGGRIYVWKGLLKALSRNADQVAWVMSHETAHVARRHVASQIERQLGYQALISFVLKKQTAQQLAGLAGNLALLRFSRDQEAEADRYGLMYAHDAGYDPTAAVAVIKVFQKLQGSEPSKLELMFGTHPGNNDRLNAVEAFIKQKGWKGKYWQP